MALVPWFPSADPRMRNATIGTRRAASTGRCLKGRWRSEGAARAELAATRATPAMKGSLAGRDQPCEHPAPVPFLRRRQHISGKANREQVTGTYPPRGSEATRRLRLFRQTFPIGKVRQRGVATSGGEQHKAE